MLSASNFDALITPAAACMPDTVSARLAPLRESGLRPAPAADVADACARLRAAAAVADATMTPLDLGSPCASYAVCSLTLADGTHAQARLITPKGTCRVEEQVPLVVMYHDADRPVRGWHHMTRFAAIGCAVLALDEGVPGFDSLEDSLCALAAPALALVEVARSLEGIDQSRIYTWGEGLGGALAALVATVRPDDIACCAVCNPLPLDASVESAGASLLDLAPRMSCPLLVGTGLRDELASTELCAQLAHACGGEAELIVYPEHAHERINDFENKVLSFFATEPRPGTKPERIVE